MSEPDVQPDLIIKGRARRDRDERILELALLLVGDVYEAETLWQQAAPTAFKPMLAGKVFEYTPDLMRWSTTAPILQAKVKAATIATATAIEEKVANLSRQLTAGELQLADWQQQMGQIIKSIEIANAAVARGGVDRLDASELARTADAMILDPKAIDSTGDVVLYQFKRLDLFARQIETRHPDADTIDKIIRRAKLYPRQSITMYEQARHREAAAVGLVEERNVLGIAEHCFSAKDDPIPDCPSQTAYGWAKLGQLTPIGLRKCRMNDKCTMYYRRADGEEIQ